MFIGYTRVSTNDLHLDMQCDLLTHVACERIYEDTVSVTEAEREGCPCLLIHFAQVIP